VEVGFDLSGDGFGGKVGIVDLQEVRKGEGFPVVGIEAVGGSGMAHFLLAPGKVPFGFLMVEAVFRFVSLQSNVEVGGELHHVAVCAFTAEEMDEILQVVEFGGLVKIAHIGEDQTQEFSFGEQAEHRLADGIVEEAEFRFVMGEELTGKLDGHMIMEQAQGRDLSKLLAYGHFSYGVGAEDKDEGFVHRGIPFGWFVFEVRERNRNLIHRLRR